VRFDFKSLLHQKNFSREKGKKDDGRDKPALFVISPLGRALSSELISMQHRLLSAKCLFAQKVGQNLSEMEVRTSVRIKKVIWDQLLASQAEIIKGKPYSAIF